MRIDGQGNYLGGIVEMVHYNGVLLSTVVPELMVPGLRAGAWEFLEEATPTSKGAVGGMVLNGNLPHPQLWRVDLDTMRANTLYAEDGADKFVAGNGRWAAWTGPGPGKPAVYWDCYGHRDPSWYPMAVDNVSGLIAVCLEQPTGRGLAVWDGHILTVVESGLLDSPEACFRGGELSYRAHGQLKLWTADGSQPVVQSVVTGVRHDLNYLIGWSEEKGLCVYNKDTGDAFALWPDGTPLPVMSHDNNSDLTELTSGFIRLVSSYNAGELPNEVRVYNINPFNATVNGQPRVPFNVQDLNVIPAPPLPSGNRNIWRGLCATNVQPGNTVWAGVAGDTRYRFDGMPWATNVPIGKLPFLGVSPREPNQYPTAEEEFHEVVGEVQRREALGETTVVVVYDDGHRPFELFDWLKRYADLDVHAIPGLYGYPKNEETAEQTKAAVEADLANIRSHGVKRAVLFRAVYTKNRTWRQQLVFDILAVEDAIIEADPTIVGDFLFGMGRPGGAYQDWPQLQTWYRERCVGLEETGPALYDSGDGHMTYVYIKTRNGLFVGSRVQDGTRRLFAIATPDEFCVWKPILTRGSKVGEPNNLVYFDLVNFPGNPIGLTNYDSLGEQARCAIRSGTQFTNGRGDDNDWTFETEPPPDHSSTHAMRLTYRADLQGGIYLEKLETQAPSVSSFRLVEALGVTAANPIGHEGKVFTEPFR